MKSVDDLPPYTTIEELIEDPDISIKDKERAFLKWVFHQFTGFGLPATVHYNGEDIEEKAVPLSYFPQLHKDLLGAFNLKEESK